MHVEIITPDETVFEGEADALTLPTADGEVTILSKHTPLIGIIVPGMITMKASGSARMFAVSRGIVEVESTGVRVLAQTVDRAEALEEQAIMRAKEAAEKMLAEKREDAETFAEATAILERELARLHVVRKHRTMHVPHSESQSGL